jgi:hypothetical protein
VPPAEPDERSEAIADAVAAFDAANLTWGQFYQNTVRQRSEAGRLLAQPVRDALGDAALSIPGLSQPAELRNFVAALELARDRVRLYVDAVDPSPAPGDIRDLPALLDEAIDLLRPYLED